MLLSPTPPIPPTRPQPTPANNYPKKYFLHIPYESTYREIVFGQFDMKGLERPQLDRARTCCWQDL